MSGCSASAKTLEYLKDPNGFIAKRVEQYGPVFKTGFFFKPAIMFGSREAIQEYRAFEGTLSADEALPETFRELHTPYGALRQSGEQHKATRANFAKVLGRAALTAYVPEIARLTSDFVEHELRSSLALRPGADCKRFALRTLFALFLGTTPPPHIVDAMYDYNAGLLSLGKWTEEFKKGRAALELLTEYCQSYYQQARAEGQLDEPRHFFLKQYSEATDENGDLFPDDRVAVTVVLMVWGAYIESAAQMGHCIRMLMLHPEAAARVREEVAEVLSAAELDSGSIPIEKVMRLSYADAVIKETLRLVPQTAGGLRINPTQRTLAGYDIPAGYVLTADPRIAFLNGDWYPSPGEFRPERFLSAAADNVITQDTFFPGGLGQHQCPGISLANLMTSILLVYLTQAFDGWAPEEGSSSAEPGYENVPIFIIDDAYKLVLTPASQETGGGGGVAAQGSSAGARSPQAARSVSVRAAADDNMWPPLPEVADTAASPEEINAPSFANALILDVRDPEENEKVRSSIHALRLGRDDEIAYGYRGVHSHTLTRPTPPAPCPGRNSKGHCARQHQRAAEQGFRRAAEH